MKTSACSSKSKSKLTSSSEVSFNPFRCDVCDGEADADDDDEFYCRSSDCNQCASEYYESKLDGGYPLGFAQDKHYRKLSKKRRSCSLSNLVDDDLPDFFNDAHTNSGGLYYSSSTRYTRPEDRRFNIENSYYETLRETEYLHEYKTELRDLQAIGYCDWVNFHLDRIKPEDLVKLNKYYSSLAAAKTEDQENAAPAYRPIYKVVSKSERQMRKDLQSRVFLFVSDLSLDLSDGIRLLHLIEILYNCKLQKEFGKMKLHKLRNMATCLEYLVDNRKLKCFGINLADLVNGNLDIMLGLLFHIRRDYESAKFSIERQSKLTKVKNFFQNYETNKQMAELEREKREKQQRVRNRLYFKSPLTLSRIKQMPRRRELDDSNADDQQSIVAPQSSSSRSSLCSHCPHRKKFNLPAIKIENLSDDETQQQQEMELSEALDQQPSNVYESIENLLENSIQRLNHLKEANDIIIQKLEQSNRNLENSNSNELELEDTRCSALDETLNDIDDEPSLNSDLIADNNSVENDSFSRDLLQSSLSSHERDLSSQEHIQIECNVEESNLAVEEIELKASKTSTDLNIAIPAQRAAACDFCEQIAEENFEPRDSVDDVQSSSYSSNQGSVSPSPSLESTTTTTSTSTSDAAAVQQALPPPTEIIVEYGPDKTTPPRIIILEQIKAKETIQGELNFAKTKTLRPNKPGIKTINEKVEDMPDPSRLMKSEMVRQEVRTSYEQSTTSDEAHVNAAAKSRNKKKRRKAKNADKCAEKSSDTCDQDYCEESVLNGERETSMELLSSEVIEEESPSSSSTSSSSSSSSSKDSSTEFSTENSESYSGGPRETISTIDESSFEVPETPNVSEATETEESLSLRRPKVIPLGWPEKAESDVEEEVVPAVEVETPRVAEPVVEAVEAAPVEPKPEEPVALVPVQQQPVETVETPVTTTSNLEETKEPEEKEAAEKSASTVQTQRRNRKRRASNYYDQIIDLTKEPEAQRKDEPKKEENAVSAEADADAVPDRPNSETQVEISPPMTSSLINESSSSSSSAPSDHCITSTPRESEIAERCPQATADESGPLETTSHEQETEIKVGTTKIVIVEKSEAPKTPAVPEVVCEDFSTTEVRSEVAETKQTFEESRYDPPASRVNDAVCPVEPQVEEPPKRPETFSKVTLNDFIVKPARKTKQRGGKSKKHDTSDESIPNKNDDALRSKDRSPPLPPDSLSSSNSLLSLSHDPGSYQRSTEDINEEKDTNNNNTCSQILGGEHLTSRTENKETMTSESMIDVSGDAKKKELNGYEVCANGAETTAQTVYLQTSNLESFSTTDSSLASYSSITSVSSSSMSEGHPFESSRKKECEIAESTSPEPASSSVSSASSMSTSWANQSVEKTPNGLEKPLLNGSAAQRHDEESELRQRNAGARYPRNTDKASSNHQENSATTKKPFAQVNGSTKENIREFQNRNGQANGSLSGEKTASQQPVIAQIAKVEAGPTSQQAALGSRNDSTPNPKKPGRKEPSVKPDFEIPTIRVQDVEVKTELLKKPAEVVSVKTTTKTQKPAQSVVNKASPKANGSKQQQQRAAAVAVSARKSSKTTEQPKSSSQPSSCIKKTLIIFLVSTFVLISVLVTFIYISINEGNFNIGDLLTFGKRYLNN